MPPWFATLDGYAILASANFGFAQDDTLSYRFVVYGNKFSRYKKRVLGAGTACRLLGAGTARRREPPLSPASRELSHRASLRVRLSSVAAPWHRPTGFCVSLVGVDVSATREAQCFAFCLATLVLWFFYGLITTVFCKSKVVRFRVAGVAKRRERNE